MNIRSVEDILDMYVNQKEGKNLYLDKRLDRRGIDYSKYIKLRYDSVRGKLIRDLYGIDGWYMMFWLMSSGENVYYSMTTINMIVEFTGIRATKTRDILLDLHNMGIIKIIPVDGDVMGIKNNTILNICILYNSDCEYTDGIAREGGGYVAIPVEFLRNVLPVLSSIEWGVFSILLVNYSYFGVWVGEDIDTGEEIYRYQKEHYSYPTQRDLSDDLGINKETVNLSVHKLSENGLIIINKTKGIFAGKTHIKGGNNRYRIPLFERVEWVYYNLYKNLSEEQKAYYKWVDSIGFEKIASSNMQYKIRNKNYIYILEYYGKVMEEYGKILDNRDYEKYKYFHNNFPIYL